MSIRAKLIVATVVGMAVLAATTGALLRAAGERSIRIAAEQAIAAAGQAFSAMERADVEKLDATLRALSTSAALSDAFAKRDRDRLAAVAVPMMEQLRTNNDITHFYFIEPEPSRKVFLRAHKPEQFGDVVHRATLSRAIDTLAIGAGTELGQTAFALRVVRPWYGPRGDLIGFVELAEEIDHFLARMKAQTGDEYGLLVEKAFLDRAEWARVRAGRRNNWDDRPRTVVVNTTMPDEEVIGFKGDASAIPDHGLYLAEEDRGERTFVRGVVPVKDAAGRRVGGLVVLHDITEMHAAMHAGRRGLFAVVLVVSAAFGFAVVTLVDRTVLRRLDRLRKETDALTGRVAAGAPVSAPKPTGEDEVGRLEGALGRLITAVIAGARQLGSK